MNECYCTCYIRIWPHRFKYVLVNIYDCMFIVQIKIPSSSLNVRQQLMGKSRSISSSQSMGLSLSFTQSFTERAAKCCHGVLKGKWKVLKHGWPLNRRWLMPTQSHSSSKLSLYSKGTQTPEQAESVLHLLKKGIHVIRPGDIQMRSSHSSFCFCILFLPFVKFPCNTLFSTILSPSSGEKGVSAIQEVTLWKRKRGELCEKRDWMRPLL